MAKWIKNLVLSFCFVAVTMVTFVGCGAIGSPLADNPKQDDIVTGNGSLAVTKGDYLYFVNGYTGYADVGDTNYDGKVTYPALYRIKLDENGHPVEVPPEYDENDKEIFDGSNALENVDILAGKVVGFEYMGLYIFGDYIYYASPYNGKDGNLEVQSSQIDFFRTKINRTSGSELIYTTEGDGANVKYSMMEFDGKVFMSILDKNKTTEEQKLVNIKFEANGNKVVDTIQGVTSVAFPKYTASNEIVTDFTKDVYYTRNLKESDGTTFTKGNVLCKFSLSTWQNSDKIFFDGDSTLTLKLMSENKLFFEKQLSTSKTASFYAVNDVNEIGKSEIRVSSQYTDYYLTPSGNYNIVANDGENLVLFSQNKEAVQIFSGKSSVIKVQGDFVYFTDNSNNSIKRLNYVEFLNHQQGQPAPQVETLSNTDVKTGQSNFVCVDDNKIYYLKSYESGNHYLQMIDLNDYDTETSSYYTHFVGVLQEVDYETEAE